MKQVSDAAFILPTDNLPTYCFSTNHPFAGATYRIVNARTTARAGEDGDFLQPGDPISGEVVFLGLAAAQRAALVQDSDGALHVIDMADLFQKGERVHANTD